MDKVKLVLEGIKPSALVNAYVFMGADKLAQEYIEEWHQDKTVRNQFAISLKNRLVSDVVKESNISYFSRHSLLDELNGLYNIIKSIDITNGLAYLHMIPKIDSITKNTEDIERPEVSILEGLLFGYNPCCIDYYVDTRHNGVRRHNLEKELPVNYKGVSPGDLCYSCKSGLIGSGIMDYKNAFIFLKEKCKV